VVLVLTGLLIYSNSLSSPFLFDDQNSILTNPQIRRLWPLSIPLSPPRDTPVAGRPVVNLSFAVNYALGGFDPWGYHVTNVVIHVMTALVLFGVLRRTRGVPDQCRVRLRGCCGSLHPLNTESVNYFSQRTESLMALLGFTCSRWYLRRAQLARPAITCLCRWGWRARSRW
jgi:hypothetical protein